MVVEPHSCTPDNDGVCHWCGVLMNEEWYEYAYGSDVLKRKKSCRKQ